MSILKNKYSSEYLVIKNFFLLCVVKLSGFILPLVTLPYVIRVVGIERVGEINLASSIMVYMSIIVAYGFNYTGTQYIAKNKSNLPRIADYYSSAMVIRFWLLCISFVILFLVCSYVDSFNNIQKLCYVTFGIVVGQFLNPIWVFQGFQQMKYITYIDIFSKLTSTILIFSFINEEHDYFLFPLFMSVSAIFSGVVCQIIIKRNLKININFKRLLMFRDLNLILSDGKQIFLQQLYVSMYGPITVIFLGLYATSIDVGYYTVAEKILNIPVMVAVVAMQAYYPYSVDLYDNNKSKYYNQILITFFSIFSIMLLCAVFLGVYNKELYYLFTGSSDVLGEDTLFVLSFGLVFSSLGTVITQVFVTINKSNVLNKISFFTMIITLLLSPVFIKCYGVIGLAMYTVMRQAFVATICITYIIRTKR